jgi:integrase
VIQDEVLASLAHSYIAPMTFIHLERYDRQPIFTSSERVALAQVVAHCTEKKGTHVLPGMKASLDRLLRPINDVIATLGFNEDYSTVSIFALVREMHERSISYWAWSEEEWERLLTSSLPSYCQQYSYALETYQRTRLQLLVIAYTIGPQTDFFLPLLEQISPQATAHHLFGKEHCKGTIDRVLDVLRTWGYATEASRRQMSSTIATLLLANRSPFLEDVTFEFLVDHKEKVRSFRHAYLERVSKVLAHWKIIDHPLPTRHESRKIPVERSNTDGIAPEWVEWCLQWYQFAGSSPTTRKSHFSQLLSVGRWLTRCHPEVTTPHQWTTHLAAEYVAAIDQMREGDFASAEYCQRMKLSSPGKPFTAHTKDRYLGMMRTFFRDLQDEPHNIPRRFNPERAFATPRAVRNQIGPNPRDLTPLWWAKIVHAAMHLTEDDVPRATNGAARYPLEFVQAVAAVWVYSGLRRDEIARLQVGCVRWQEEDVVVPETGGVLSREATCFLTVPTNKTTTTFQKPVNPILGRKINAWEKIRATGQLAQRDRKTGTSVEYLFSHKGYSMGDQYLNEHLIPLLCKKAGVPEEDERGSITSHRARATIATLLYNAPEGLSIWELMQWLGHKDPKTTQHYARVKPTKLAAAYTKAERNSRLVEVLVDTKADSNGTIKVYYILGEHGLCSNPDWAACLYRMACIKCPFFVPRNQALLIESYKTVKRFMEVVELTDEELAAVQDDVDKLHEAVQRTKNFPEPHELRRRAKGSTQRGIQLTVLNNLHGS